MISIYRSATNDWYIGQIDGRQLHIRWLVPDRFLAYDSLGFKLSIRKMLNPTNWWKVATLRSSWAFWIRRSTEINHRCYCPVGSSIDAHILICGWGCWLWYSRYDGETPCPCDQAINELFGDGDDEDSGIED